jgi:N-methylhydantoinase A
MQQSADSNGASSPPYVIATDVGGTFVDAVLLDGDQHLTYGKAPSTPDRPSDGLLAAINAAAVTWNLPLASVMADCRLFLHGTTVSTNALIQMTGGPTGLLTTRGFEDILPIGRAIGRVIGLDDDQLMDRQHTDPPFPLVPLELIKGITERVDSHGEVLAQLDHAEVERAVADLVDQGVRSIAISFLWSFRNPVHEQWVRNFVQATYPDVHVTASSDLVPVIREYERTNTTAVNAYLQPVFDGYAADLHHRLQTEHSHEDFLVMQSIGGVAPAREVRSTPVTTLLSGPVGGVMAARNLGRVLHEESLITTDMGGTSFDVGLIVDGLPETGGTTVIERRLLLVPAVQVETIGAGGGSVAWLDPAGTLRVGPRSQGAVPGPACYGRGGTEPTVTDADVVLGYIDPERFLGGTFQLDRSLATAALTERIAKPLGMSVTAAAAAIYTIVNAHMADLVRRVSVGRGFDPRRFALIAFGGCGPTHVSGYGPELGVRKIIVPALAPVFSALGIGSSDIRHFFSKSVRLTVDRGIPPNAAALASVRATIEELVEKAEKQLTADGLGADASRVEVSVDMRYRGQTHELTIPVGPASFNDNESLESVLETFEARYEQRFGGGSKARSAPCEVNMVRVDGEAQLAASVASAATVNGGSNIKDSVLGSRPVYWPAYDDFVDTPAYSAERLGRGARIEGPAVVEGFATSIPLHPGQALTVDNWGNLIIE